MPGYINSADEWVHLKMRLRKSYKSEFNIPEKKTIYPPQYFVYISGFNIAEEITIYPPITEK